MYASSTRCKPRADLAPSRFYGSRKGQGLPKGEERSLEKFCRSYVQICSFGHIKTNKKSPNFHPTCPSTLQLTEISFGYQWGSDLSLGKAWSSWPFLRTALASLLHAAAEFVLAQPRNRELSGLCFHSWHVLFFVFLPNS